MINTALLVFCSVWLLSTPLAGRWVGAHRHTNSTPSANVAAPAAPDLPATRARLMLSISELNAAWQRAWRVSEGRRIAMAGGTFLVRQRSPLVHCHPDGSTDIATNAIKLDLDSVIRLDFKSKVIANKESWFATCPTWMLASSIKNVQDESNSLDGALLETFREPIRELRANLLAQLESAAQLFPHDNWIAGQRTRYLVDQEEVVTALAAVTACGGDAWWCAALRGYTLAWAGDTRLADSAFTEMQRAMPASQQCAWDDVGDLLASIEQKAYAALSCEARKAAHERLWWLADPMFRDAGNPRLLEQQVRRVRIALRKAVAHDERYTWRDEYGGNSLVGLISRYGWPTYTAWGDDDLDRSHTEYLAEHKAPRVSPHTSFEYTLNRVHTLPAWTAVVAPFTAADSSWTLSKDNANGIITTDWWPEEHFQPERRIVQFSEGQTAMLRRQSQIMVAAAVRLNHPAIRKAPASDRADPYGPSETSASVPRFDALLISSPAPGKIDSLAQSIVSAGGTIALQGLIYPSPTILAVEARGLGNTIIDGRTRYGITPPPPLDSMKAGEIALSDPVILSAADDAVDLQLSAESLLERMLGSTRLDAKTRRIGIYWETYGIHAADTVMVSVRIAGDQELTAMRRLGMALNVAPNPNRAIVQRWTEPDLQRRTRTLEGPVPVQMRSLLLNLSALEAGPYILEVIVERRDGVSATGRRRIILEP